MFHTNCGNDILEVFTELEGCRFGPKILYNILKLAIRLTVSGYSQRIKNIGQFVNGGFQAYYYTFNSANLHGGTFYNHREITTPFATKSTLGFQNKACMII